MEGLLLRKLGGRWGNVDRFQGWRWETLQLWVMGLCMAQGGRANLLLGETLQAWEEAWLQCVEQESQNF